jgi:nitroreductase
MTQADHRRDLLKLIATTRAIRRYRPERIPEDDLARMFFIATRAPSGSNQQSFRFMVLRDDPVSQRARHVLRDSYVDQWPKSRAAAFITEAAKRSERAARMNTTMNEYVEGLANVPLIVLACMQIASAPRFQDGASLFPACQNLLLAARVLGYGGVITQWHFPVHDDLRRILAMPDDVTIAAVLTFGVPMGSHGPVKRKPVGSLVFEGGWSVAPTWASDEILADA